MALVSEVLLFVHLNASNFFIFFGAVLNALQSPVVWIRLWRTVMSTEQVFHVLCHFYCLSLLSLV